MQLPGPIRYAAVLPLVSLAACDGDPTGAEPEVIGSYHAVEFMLYMDEMAFQRDVLAEGGSLDITLHEDGTTTGALVIPDEYGEGVDGTHDLSGTWDVREAVVTFDDVGDTFLDQTEFRWEGNGVLSAETSTFPTRVVVRLSRGDPTLAH